MDMSTLIPTEIWTGPFVLFSFVKMSSIGKTWRRKNNSSIELGSEVLKHNLIGLRKGLNTHIFTHQIDQSYLQSSQRQDWTEKKRFKTQHTSVISRSSASLCPFGQSHSLSQSASLMRSPKKRKNEIMRKVFRPEKLTDASSLPWCRHHVYIPKVSMKDLNNIVMWIIIQGAPSRPSLIYEPINSILVWNVEYMHHNSFNKNDTSG